MVSSPYTRDKRNIVKWLTVPSSYFKTRLKLVKTIRNESFSLRIHTRLKITENQWHNMYSI